jgi:hypothetical protein
MVAAQRHEMVRPAQGDELLQDSAGIRPPVDVIAKRYQGIRRLKVNERE